MKNEKSKHTPGPWSVNDIYPHQVGAYLQGKPGRFVCETINHAAGNCCHTEEDRSNARLIAAAPELLAALELALTTLSSVACNESDEIDNVKTEIANAINKAKGE